jgi:tRNA nucleotidyltransferase/poly(A) polymerase
MKGIDTLLADKGLRRILDLLNGNGEEARVVGGAVRNALLGRAATDTDIATTATPDIVMARAKAAGVKSIPTGLPHGTVTLRADGRSFEVTTLREDIETDGRHAKIRFGRDFAADALRRDFTINALSVDRDDRVHDYAGGLADIEAGRVRFIGDPATRIREDYLRILRFFRFSADYAAGDFDRDGSRRRFGNAAGSRSSRASAFGRNC